MADIKKEGAQHDQKINKYLQHNIVILSRNLEEIERFTTILGIKAYLDTHALFYQCFTAAGSGQKMQRN